MPGERETRSLTRRAHRPGVARPLPLYALLTAATAAATLTPTPPANAADSHWLSPVSGNWTESSKWSTAPVYPNNPTTPGTTYTAFIDAGGGAYTVSLNQDVTLDGLVLNAAGGTLQHVNAALDLAGGTLDLRAGRYFMPAGIIRNARIQGAASAPFDITEPGFFPSPLISSMFDDVTLATSVAVSRTRRLFLINDFALDGGRITLHPGAELFYDQVAINNLAGAGEILFQNPLPSPDSLPAKFHAGHLTIAPGVAVRTVTGSGSINAVRLVNLGTITAQGAGNQLTVHTSSVPPVNQGLIEVKDGATLWLLGNLSNAGTLRIAGGTLNLTGAINFSGLGNVQRSGGSVNLTGTYDNVGRTLDLSATPAGPVGLGAGARVTGGTLIASAGAIETVKTIDSPSSVGVADARLDDDVHVHTGVHFNAVRSTLAPGRTIRFVDSPGPSDRLTALNADSRLFEGVGHVVFDSPAGLADQPAVTGVNLVIGKDFTIRTGAGGGKIESDGLINRGNIIVQTPGQRLWISGQGWRNEGTIRLSDGILELRGAYTTAALGNIVRTGGSIYLWGRIDNTDDHLALDARTGAYDLIAHVTGGRLSTADDAVFNVPASSTNAGLFNLTLAGHIDVHDAATLGGAGQINLENATVRLVGPSEGAAFEFGGAHAELLGDGRIIFDAGPENLLATHDQRLDIGPGVTILTGDGGGRVRGFQTLNNAGTISARAPGRNITISASDFTNTGLIEAVNGGTITLDGIWANKSIIRIDGGTLVVKTLPSTRDALVAYVRDQIRAARNAPAGLWKGQGITTSADSPLAALAVGLDGNDVLVRSTYDGDATLDGRVNADDYFRIDAGFLAQPRNPQYAQGDFNYDGKINADDYFLIDSAFLGQGAPLTGASPALLPSSVTVPEPGTPTLLFIAVLASLPAARRRRAGA